MEVDSFEFVLDTFQLDDNGVLRQLRSICRVEDEFPLLLREVGWEDDLLLNRLEDSAEFRVLSLSEERPNIYELLSVRNAITYTPG